MFFRRRYYHDVTTMMFRSFATDVYESNVSTRRLVRYEYDPSIRKMVPPSSVRVRYKEDHFLRCTRRVAPWKK